MSVNIICIVTNAPPERTLDVVDKGMKGDDSILSRAIASSRVRIEDRVDDMIQRKSSDP